MKTPKKKQPVKARKMWSVTSKEHRDLQPSKKDADFHQQMHSDLTGDPALVEPIFIIPATQEAHDAMTAQMSVVVYAYFHGVKPHPEYATAYVKVSKQLLAAIGITAPTK